MADPSLAIQTALYQRLSGAGYAVFDNVTQAEGKPYLVIGEDTLTEDDTTCDYGFEGSVLIRCFADGANRTPGKELAAAVLGHLRARLVVTGWQVVTWAYEGTVPQTVEDGLAHQRIISFRVSLRAV